MINEPSQGVIYSTPKRKRAVHTDPQSRVGMRFGKILLVEVLPDKAGKLRNYRCQCDCGGEVIARMDHKQIKRGFCNLCRVTSGGPRKPLEGQVFGKLTVLQRAYEEEKQGCRYWCRCECGVERTFQGSQIRKGGAVSCGCEHKPNAGGMKHGLRHHRVYTIWGAMRSRCNRPADISYPYYGARGVKVCERWLNSFPNFVEDMGLPNEDQSIDRIDNELGYSPDNCRWSTEAEQHANRRDNVKLTYQGETLNVTQWAKKLGINRMGIYSRIRTGWRVEDALTCPFNRGARRPHP